MNYITVKEAAEKWNVSERKVQKLCSQGRVEGARKFGGVWEIPASGERTGDSIKDSGQKVMKTDGDQEEFYSCLMPLINTPFKPGHCREYLDNMEEGDRKQIAWAEYYYFSGQPEKTAEIAQAFLDGPDGDLKLSASLLSAYSNIALGEIKKARQALDILKKALRSRDGHGQECRAKELFVGVAAGVLLHIPAPEGLPEMDEYLARLPIGLRSFAMYVRAHYQYLKGEYGESLGIAETALMMGGKNYPIPSIYLHMVAVMDYMSMRKPEKAREHLLAAWETARQDELIQSFGEHHGLLGGMLETVLKKDWPEEFRKIIGITYRFSEGWRRIHNPDTGHFVADNLTTTEFAVAMLAARGWTNQEISRQMNISLNTVKSHISAALQKLQIRQRQELRKFMLR